RRARLRRVPGAFDSGFADSGPRSRGAHLPATLKSVNRFRRPSAADHARARPNRGCNAASELAKNEAPLGRALFVDASGRGSPGPGAKTPTRPSTDNRKSSINYPKRSLSRDFVLRALSPRIAVVSSPDADVLCQENGLTNFCELLRPFGDRIDGKVTARDNQGLPLTLEPLFVRFVELSKLEAPDPDAVLRLMAQCVRKKFQTYDGPKYDSFRSKKDVNDQYLNCKD
ncbi:MAG: hypothetical protein BJ554DRAFT_271, partial [Olpidium bornovanus]